VGPEQTVISTRVTPTNQSDPLLDATNVVGSRSRRRVR